MAEQRFLLPHYLFPVGFGANAGDVFAGASVYSDNGTGTGKSDGVASLGFGLGNSTKYLGFEFSAAITDLKDDFLGDGSFSFKMHRRIPWGLSSVAIGLNSFADWGRNFAVPSYFLSFSRSFALKGDRDAWFSSLMLHLGTGTGSFHSRERVIELANIKNNNKGDSSDLYALEEFGFFAGAAVSLQSWVNFIVNWNGVDMATGFSFAPFSKHRILVNVFGNNVLEKEGNEAAFVVGVSWSDNIFRWLQ